ncbi:alpha/beta hydrolase [Legionella sp. 16cNR16C]|uniref:alpha/beta hydrolase n=1 Tax=Legionella sp. 16cNR16C TaxID=2905656 RepID=UPI001E2E7930|nr:alpha/beta hydrolase [Legionella sp. 16cNR16C]MCE3044644.1 alpha/beta hydrolase [Legionella sp. 16cNR16C]
MTTLKKIITLHSDDHFEVELYGNTLQAKTAVIFVHGFGVKRQSRGLFVDIESICLDTMLSVRAEYSHVLNDRCIALPFQIQRQRLNKIIQYIQDHYNIDNFIFVGHSQGCIIIALERPHNALILLLAPPLFSPFEEFINTKGWKNPGSHLNIQGNSRLVRSDLIIEVPTHFWSEFKTIDAQSLYSDLAKHNDVRIVFAENDQVLGNQQPIDHIPTYSIKEANHDFSSTPRMKLLQLISKLILDRV